MNLTNILQEGCVVIDADCSDKESVLRKIAEVAKRNPILKKIKEEDIYQSLVEREKLGSTALFNRIAIPHCKLKKIKDFVVGIVRLENAVDFDSLDENPTNVFVFIIAPESERNEHLRLLSAISRYLRIEGNPEKILTASSAEKVRESFLRHTKVNEDIKQEDDHRLYTVIVQKEEYFEDVLDIFAELENSSFTVLEGNNASSYLYRMPLFSSLWEPSHNTFCRVVTAMVKKSDSQLVANQINSIISNLENRTGILMMVQQIFYQNGALDI